jgi:hypothetical protein
MGLGLGLAVGCLAAPASSFGATQVLTFEGLQNLEPIQQFYNGGAGGFGSVGPDYNIVFGDDSLALVDADSGGSGNIANEPSGNTVAFFLDGDDVVMNSLTGFQDGFSFFYSSQFAASVTVYDGPDATGNVLATIPLVAQHDDGCSGDPNGTFCNWTPVGVTFVGTARSVSFGGTANQVVFDDITLGSETPGEPEGPFGDPSCSDSVDNDNDGQTDAADSGCAPPPSGTDLCFGQPATITGNGVVTGTEGDDVIITGNGNDVVDGKGGNDRICTRGGDDHARGGAGNDRLNSGNGNDNTGGQSGNDIVQSTGGNDDVQGGDGMDHVTGGEGNDTLNGGNDVDAVEGEGGNDLLAGNAGSPDYCDGGAGTDATPANGGCETIVGIP